MTGEALHKAIVWLDTRTHEVCDKLSEAYGGRNAFKEKCGLPISTYFSGATMPIEREEERDGEVVAVFGVPEEAQ